MYYIFLIQYRKLHILFIAFSYSYQNLQFRHINFVEYFCPEACIWIAFNTTYHPHNRHVISKLHMFVKINSIYIMSTKM